MIIKDRKISSYIVDCLILALCIFIPYQQVSGHSFVEFDDGTYAFYNTYIIRGLRWDSIVWAFTNTDSANWHPLTWISHLIDRELFLSHPGGYLMENVAWHALAAMFCYHAFRRCTGDRLIAFFIALIFAIHPVNVENVAWASERKSLLNAFFWFCGIASFITFLERRNFRWYGFTVILFILSLFSKPMSVTFPCTLFLVYCWREIYLGRGRENFRWLLDAETKKTALLLLPMLAISVYFSWVTTFAQHDAMSSTEAYGISKRLINVLVSYGEYLSMYFNPRSFAAFYPLFPSELTLSAAIFPLVLLISISTTVVLLARRVPELLLGWVWFLGTMVPVIGLVQVGSQSHADRYLYIPMIGLSFLLPTLIRAIHLPAKITTPFANAALAVVGLALIPMTYIQVGYWQDGMTLFSHSIDVTGDCLMSVANVAIGYGRYKKFDAGLRFLDSKLKIATRDGSKAKLNSLKAIMLLNTKKYKECMDCAQTAFDLGDNQSGNATAIAFCSFKLDDLAKAKKYLDISDKLEKPVVDSDFIAMQSKIMKSAFAAEVRKTSDKTTTVAGTTEH